MILMKIKIFLFLKPERNESCVSLESQPEVSSAVCNVSFQICAIHLTDRVL